MRLPRNAEPHLAANLVVANNLAHAWVKNFRAAARKRIDPSLLHFQERILDREFCDARKVADFDHRERLEVHAGEALLEPADEFQEIVEGKVWMQAADDVKLRRAFTNALVSALINFFQCECIRAGRIRIAPKGA